MYENQLNLVICRKTKKYPHYLLLNSFEVNIFAPSIDTASYTASYLEKVYYSIKTRYFLYNKLKHNILYVFQGAIVIHFQEIMF